MVGWSWAKSLLRSAGREPWAAAASAVAGCTLVAMVVIVTSPWMRDWTSYGFHDWDAETSFRYLVKISLLEHGELPGWNPFACGGYPSWGFIEGATNLVSPWLPFYLLAPLPAAIRIEAIGQGLLGAVGAYAVAGCFTRSSGARLLVAALWAVNGRWGLQTAAGHTWHLAYAWTPWCLYFYERARLRGGVGYVALAGASFAMLVYAGGIYPLPHTMVLVSAYAALCAIGQRRLGPLWILAACGLVGFGLSAPKLLPMLDTFSTDQRLIASTERLSPGAFVTLLTSRQQGFYDRPARVHPYGWHEWGMYISTAGALLLAWAFVFVEGRRERALKAVGALLVVLGFGAFHELAPWTLLHEHVPVFKSQHVPSRFLYPAVLVLALVAAAGLGRAIERRRRGLPWLDLVLALAVAAVAVDVALVARQPMARAMWMQLPEIPTGRAFRFEWEPPFHYRKRDWASPLLPNMMANTGVLHCYGVPPLPKHRMGALQHDHPRYRGEAYLEDGGEAVVTERTLNTATVELAEPSRGATLVYNMNYWRGWHSDVGPVRPSHGAVSVRVPPGTTTVRFFYRPPNLWLGLLLAAVTAASLGALGYRRRRRRDPQNRR